MIMSNNGQGLNIRLFHGTVNRELSATYVYVYRNNSSEYPTIKRSNSGSYLIEHNYGLSITEGYGKNRIFIGCNLWNQFVTLFSKSISIISENLWEIFPGVNSEEFEIDQRVLDRFQSEKACSTAGITMSPTVWVDSGQQCYPAIQIKTLKDECVVPLEDAIPLNNLLSHIDPIAYGFNAIQMMATILK